LEDSSQRALSLLDEHGPRLHRLLTRITLREDAAEDLLQELFLRLTRGAALARAVDPLAYAVRTATRLAFDWRRSERRRRDRAPLLVEPKSDDALPLPCERREELEALLDAISRLPSASRELIVLHYLEGQPYEQLAASLRTTPHRCRALCHKALARLRALTRTAATSTRQPDEP
jgi:RNA polymerase sigma-70 factor (ECF subfamily)